tara:strand:- start:4 stop:339 length:336 start_codon:yes stop_codon:yes gene_type:complete
MEDNKLIAEFMEFPTHTDAVDDRTIAYYVGESIMHTDNTENENDCDVFHPDDMQFQTSGEWLKPVVEKIEDYLYDNVGKVGYFDECLSSNNLDVRYKAVVEFIKTYNDGRM